jgi:hypothetical protein
MAPQLTREGVGNAANESSLFPSVTEGRSTYTSPLSDILKDLRRKHVVAAAATTGKHMSLIQEEEESVIVGVGSETCTCQKRVNSPSGRSSLFGGASFGREDSVKQLNEFEPSPTNGVDLQMCIHCGKKEPFDPIGEKSQKKSNYARRSTISSKTRPAMMPSQHVAALLECTPHLRHLSLWSTDMQGAGNLNSSRSLLSLVSPSPAPTTSNGEATQVFKLSNMSSSRQGQSTSCFRARFLLVGAFS